MSLGAFSRTDVAAKQAAFLGLLQNPQATPWATPTLYRLVVRHESDLTRWATRLGYQLVRVDQTYRLRRTPLDGGVAMPQRHPAPRRPRILALATAAILEDQRVDSITLQEISDAVRQFIAVHDLLPYDPESRSQRRALVDGVQLLQEHGVLENRVATEEILNAWERQGVGIGGGYLIHRDALVQLVDTRNVELALHPSAPDVKATRYMRLLRELVETQALYPGWMSEEDQAYLTRQRSQLVDRVEEMTGGTVEVRADAWTLILPDDNEFARAANIAFPDTTADTWVALAMLDALIQCCEATGVPGQRRCSSQQVDDAAHTVHSNRGPQLTAALRESSTAVRQRAQYKLVEAGLLHIGEDGGWLLTPAAARYRDAELHTADRPAAVVEPMTALFEEDA
ncbi:MAG: DUF2398 family protein [Arachnia sp.]